jgi:hypothetical protein
VAYRDGQGPARAEFDSERERIDARARLLAPAARRHLPAKLRRDLSETRAALDVVDAGVDPGRAAELLADYERTVEAGFALEEARKATPGRLFASLFKAAVVLGVGATLAIVLYPLVALQSTSYFHRDVWLARGVAVACKGCDERAAAPGLGAAGLGRDTSCERDCGLFGRCTRVKNDCVARRDRDCKKSDVCREQGRCVARNGVCGVASGAGELGTRN